MRINLITKLIVLEYLTTDTMLSKLSGIFLWYIEWAIANRNRHNFIEDSNYYRNGLEWHSIGIEMEGIIKRFSVKFTWILNFDISIFRFLTNNDNNSIHIQFVYEILMIIIVRKYPSVFLFRSGFTESKNVKCHNLLFVCVCVCVFGSVSMWWNYNSVNNKTS